MSPASIIGRLQRYKYNYTSHDPAGRAGLLGCQLVIRRMIDKKSEQKVRDLQ